MYGIYANIGGILMVNVTIYSIHGSYGYEQKCPWLCYVLLQFSDVFWRKLLRFFGSAQVGLVNLRTLTEVQDEAQGIHMSHGLCLVNGVRPKMFVNVSCLVLVNVFT
jgi:hypothetical protein